MSEDFGNLSYRCDPARAALVVIDVQRDFCLARGAENPSPSPRVAQMVANLDRLLGCAHGADVPAVFVQTLHDRASDTPEWRSRRGSLVDYEKEVCRPGTGGEEFFGVAPDERDRVVVKHRYDAFVRTELDELLHTMNRTSLLFTGIVTDICVETSLRHAVCLDYLATMVADGCAALDDEHHEAALARVGRSFGLVATTDEVLANWAVVNAPSGAGAGTS